MRGVVKSTRAFETWMKARTDVSGRLLKKKHSRMDDGAFPFLRATFYRWVEQWPEQCPQLAKRDTDVLLAVGDLHVENFGVWRDSRHRLVWGINDFDEACELPFTSDLVRLATSALLAAEAAGLDIRAMQVFAPLLDGYRLGLRAKGEPIILSRRYRTLTKLTEGTRESPRKFWSKKLERNDNPPIAEADLPKGLQEMFRASFPPGAKIEFREQRSPGGLGSLGRRRYTAIHTAGGGLRDAREAKALVPSAYYWCAGQKHMLSQTATLLQHAIRVPDPYFQIHDKWLVRQLAPDIAKLDMPTDAQDKRLALAPELLRLMGRETANIHLGSGHRCALERRLKDLGDDGWLSQATEQMASCTREDHAEWAKRPRE